MLNKIHRIIVFSQEAWIKRYIDMDIKSRTEPENDFEKGFFKLMHKSVFGKTMENFKKHRNIKIC